MLRNPYQPPEFLTELLDILVDPMTHAPLEPNVREGNISSLQTGVGEEATTYRVVNNIPHMVPDLEKEGSRPEVVAAWQMLQKRELDQYIKTSVGTFSVDGNPVPVHVGKSICNSGLKGRCLDIGCGVLPLPAYMCSNGNIRFFGIDPLIGKEDRDFPFVQALGEHIPFKDRTFEGALFASTIDHQLSPMAALLEARRVLRHHGRLFIWYADKGHSMRYLRWKWDTSKKMKPKMFDEHHMWGFNEKGMRSIVKKAGFIVNGVLPLPDGSSRLLIATKHGNGDERDGTNHV